MKDSLCRWLSSNKRLVFAMVGMATVWLLLHIFWMTCDPGVPSMWEYGYNATDEGYYLAGGKEKFLWGTFVDLSRTEAFTYGFSSGTHWLSYLAHQLFGLSCWTWRLPFYAINLLAWCCLAGHLARRIGALSSVVCCTAFSIIPLVLAYDRTASNDVLIGSLLLLAYIAATGKNVARLLLAAFLTGAIVLVKPSVWVLLPIVLAGILSTQKTKSRAVDAGLFLLATVGAILLLRLCAALAVLPDATRNGCSIFEIVKRTTTHYPLPSIFAFSDHLRGLSAFPRDPSFTLLAYLSVLLVPIPILFIVRDALRRRLGWQDLLYLSLPLYVAAVSVMNTLYTHYFLPIITLLPIVWTEMQTSLAPPVEESPALPTRKTLALFSVFCLLVPASAYFMLSGGGDPAAAQNFYSRIYNFPAQNVWLHTWPQILCIVAVFVMTSALFVPFRSWKRVGAAVALSGVLAGSVVFASLPAISLAPHLHKTPNVYLMPTVLSLGVSLFLIVGVASFPRLLARRSFWFSLPLLFAALGYALTPVWRQAGRELFAPGTHLHQQSAETLKRILPSDAIVIGERSNQMLMSLPIRTATTFAANSNPIPIIESILEKEPDAKLYALIDTQHAYNLQHFQKNQEHYRLQLVQKLSMPSFGDGRPCDVHLCKIQVRNTKKEHGNDPRQ